MALLDCRFKDLLLIEDINERKKVLQGFIVDIYNVNVNISKLETSINNHYNRRQPQLRKPQEHL